ncbi:hypothetical protein BV25DRAFT_1928349 [Artomyces pyxidatus]|uniref:Uncharacterized protein n=1 Tax=Artomyces pyxidatus TaxID=48021 RepID=A0ACB8SI66_9AGAM|nr:hypothetical protein BV25DRAFT_1928349 [Artomyces pyxidatus]
MTSPKTRFTESEEMVHQITRLNQLRVHLKLNDMGISDLQCCLILLNALPNSYSIMRATTLGLGPPSQLTPDDVISRIYTAEGKPAEGSPDTGLGGLHAVGRPLPMGKKEKNDVTCHYCKKKGHISPDCRKKKADEKKKKASKSDGDGGGGGSSNKAANSHVLDVPLMASIEEVVESNKFISVALYSAVRSHWMIDSGATHHITPHRSEFTEYTPLKGYIRLGDNSKIE